MSRPLRVLIIEDSEDDVALVLRELRRAGYEPEFQRVETAEEMKEALAGQKWEIVICDYAMPRFNAPAALRVLRESGIDIPFIIVSGTIGEDTAVEVMKAGAHDYIMKWNLKRLVPAIERELREAELRRAKRRAEEELRESENKFRELFHNANDAIFLNRVSEEGRLDKFLEANQVACQRLGYSREEFLGMSLEQIIAPERLDETLEALRQLLAQGHVSFETVHIAKDGSKIPVEVNVRVFTLNRNRVALSVARDITERKRAEEKIYRLAYYDALTELPNRALFIDRVAWGIVQARRNQMAAAVIFLDLDRFSTINDTLGSEVGDRLLQGVAQRLTGSLRETDLAARVGGDDFAVLALVAHAEDGARVAENILEALRPAFEIDDHKLYVTASIGVSIYPYDGDDAHNLLKNAGAAMQLAKEQGGNGYQFFTPSMHTLGLKRLLLESNLRRALERQEFVLHYQPQVEVETGKTIAVEALIRWQNPERGLVAPGEFIPLAEDTGLIVPIGEWVLHTACSQCKSWQKLGFPQARVSINLSARQFQQPNLVQLIADALAGSKLDPNCLELELTENVVMKNPEQAAATLRRLKEIGVSISLDDFGTGYSSLSYLKNLPIDGLKIDRSFVRDLTSDPNDAAIIMAVITLAHSLKLKVIAEGVENEEQLSFLRLLRCDAVQGYFYSRPMPAEAVREWLFKGQYTAGAT